MHKMYLYLHLVDFWRIGIDYFYMTEINLFKVEINNLD